MYWLRAGVPTSNCPSGESPTYEGMICAPSAASTSTFPSTSAATSELVVPRSMPTMMSAMALLSCRGRHAADDLHLGDAQHAAVAGISWAEHVENCTRRHVRRLHHVHGLHHGGIERPAHTWDFPYIKSPQQIIEALPCQQIALYQSFQHRALTEVCADALQALEAALCLRQATRETVADVEQLGDQLET